MALAKQPQKPVGKQPPPDAAAKRDPMEIPENREKVELAKNYVFHLLKGIKQIGMYRHQEARFAEFLKGAHDAVSQFTAKFGALSMKVEAQNFSLLGQNLFSEESPLPYKFFRDGIRQLIFRPNIEMEEMVKLTLIAISDPDRGAEDILSQLWKAQLPNVEYVVVESFKMDEFSEEEVQVEVDQIVSYLYSRLRSSSDDFMRFARLDQDDLEANLEDIDQMRGAVIQGVTATDDIKAKMQREIEEEESNRLFPKLVSTVFQVVEGGIDNPGLVEDMLIQLLDALLLQEDLATLNSIVLKLKAMEKTAPNESITRLRETFLAKMAEEQRLTRVGEILKTTRPKHPQDLTRYLAALDPACVPILLTVLETVEIPENRQLLCDVLATFAKDLNEPFIHRLTSDRPQTVRDMVYIMEKAQMPGRVKHFGTVLKHKNLAVKLEAMAIIARGRTGECRKLITECLTDEQTQVRAQAARILPEFDRERAYMDLSMVVKAPAFEKRPSEEKMAVFGAIGSTGSPLALQMLSEMLKIKGGLFNKQKILDDKLLAVHALGETATIHSYKILQELAEDKEQPPEVNAAVRKAIFQTKKKLFGQTGDQQQEEA